MNPLQAEAARRLLVYGGLAVILVLAFKLARALWRCWPCAYL